MTNTVVVVAYVGSNGRSMVGQRDVNPPLASGELTPYLQYRRHCAQPESDPGAQLPRIPGSSRLRHGLGREDARRPAVSDRDVHARDAGREADCQSGDRAHVVRPHRADRDDVRRPGEHAAGTPTLRTRRPASPTWTRVSRAADGDQSPDDAAICPRRCPIPIRRCTDISSGNWSQEGGTNILNPYDVEDDRGPCTFQLRTTCRRMPCTRCRSQETRWSRAGRSAESSMPVPAGRSPIGGIQALSNNIGATGEPRRLRSRCAGL